MTTQHKSVDQYINTFPKEVQEKLRKIRQTIHEVVPNGEEAIGYQMPAVKLNGKYLIYFAGWKKHVSIYPVPNASGALAKEMSPYIAGKGTLKFPLNKSIPLPLIKKVIKLKIKEHLNRWPIKTVPK